MIKKTTIVLYIVVVVVLASTTIIENFYDTAFTDQYFYGSWWFCLLWTLLVIFSITYFVKSKVKRWNTILLHLAMIIILAGALLTHLTSFKGIVHIRGDQATDKYFSITQTEQSNLHELPFYIKLNHFEIVNHAGTTAAADYITHFDIIDGSKTITAQVAMNKIYNYHGIRFYQASYDTDNLGSYLSINSDPYGIPVTYTGYALLFFSLIWLLINPKGTFRKLLKSDIIKKGLMSMALLFSTGLLTFSNGSNNIANVKAATTIPKETAEKFGSLFINYNNRICPVQTFALDYVKKIYGKREYNDANAEQILMSWIFYSKEWNSEPIIYIKNADVRKKFSLEKYSSVTNFFHNNNYILGQYVMEYNEGQHDGFHKACADIDGRLQLIMTLQQGQPLMMFPHTFKNNKTEWFSPFDEYPEELPKMDILFIKNVFPLIYGQIAQGNYSKVDNILDKILEYQRRNAGKSMPSDNKVKAEKIYNTIPFSSILFMTNLTLGFLSLLLVIIKLTNGKSEILHIPFKIYGKVFFTLLSISMLALTTALILRWIISGNIPLTNGYESMLCVAWFTMIITITASICNRQLSLLFCTFGFLLSGFFLLVSNISQMDPAIGTMMPVLNSPLLSLHVSIIMMGFALLALTFICGLTAMILYFINRINSNIKDNFNIQMIALQTLSRIFLYPAMTMLGLGIFIGAIWANISWGAYWTWDPKETWSLITFMIYAVALHSDSLHVFKKPIVYHIYIIVAFLSILMTYFGVNYILGGMHSYA